MNDALDIAAVADDQQLLAHVIDYYHATLRNSPEALDYLQTRGLTNGDAIDQFRIGYCDRTLCLKLPAKQIKAGRELRARLTALGVLRSSGHEHFRGSVVFPVLACDGTGRIVDMYGHKRDAVHLRKTASKHGPSTSFNVNAKRSPACCLRKLTMKRWPFTATPSACCDRCSWPTPSPSGSPSLTTRREHAGTM